MKAPAEIPLAQPTIEESVQNLGTDRMQPFRQACDIGSLGGFSGSAVGRTDSHGQGGGNAKHDLLIAPAPRCRGGALASMRRYFAL